MLKSLSLVLILVVFSGVCANAQEDKPIEYRLAVINAKGYVSEDHITVARFRSLLNQLSSTFTEDEEQIADITVYSQKILKKYGIEESPLNIMEGLNKISSSRTPKQKYAEYVQVYMILRHKGYAHSEAISEFRSMLLEQTVKQIFSSLQD